MPPMNILALAVTVYNAIVIYKSKNAQTKCLGLQFFII